MLTIYELPSRHFLTYQIRETNIQEHEMERPRRTVVKAIIWNLMGLAMMSLVGFLMTGSAFVGGSMALINTAIGLSTYFIYERIWSGISWGRYIG